MLDFTPQHVVVLGPDRDRTLLYANQTALDYFGFTLEEWRSGDRRKHFHPDDWERLMSEAHSKFLSGLPHKAEVRLRRKDGQYRWFLGRWNPVRNEQERLMRWYVAGTDIEDRKQAEEKLQGCLAIRGRRGRCQEKTALNMHERLWRTSSPFRPTLYISRLRQTPASGRARLSPRRSSMAALIISMKETGPCSVLVPKRLRKSCKNCIERFTR